MNRVLTVVVALLVFAVVSLISQLLLPGARATGPMATTPHCASETHLGGVRQAGRIRERASATIADGSIVTTQCASQVRVATPRR